MWLSQSAPMENRHAHKSIQTMSIKANKTVPKIMFHEEMNRDELRKELRVCDVLLVSPLLPSISGRPSHRTLDDLCTFNSPTPFVMNFFEGMEHTFGRKCLLAVLVANSGMVLALQRMPSVSDCTLTLSPMCCSSLHVEHLRLRIFESQPVLIFVYCLVIHRCTRTFA
jgi:hypothetical protein